MALLPYLMNTVAVFLYRIMVARGSDSIKSISRILMVRFISLGPFSNRISPSTGRLFSSREVVGIPMLHCLTRMRKVVLDAFQLGGSGEDVAIHTDSAFSGNILFSGISDRGFGC